MAEREGGPPIVAIPERLERRMRLGPFPSGRDALKFLCYAAAAAVVALLFDGWLWIPLATVAFAITVWRPNDQGWDEQVVTWLRWRTRRYRAVRTMTARPPRGLVRQGLLELAPQRFVAVLQTSGVPVAYLPPDELARRFELFRELLRSVDDHFACVVAAIPIQTHAVWPDSTSSDLPDGEARAGYGQLVTLLCRRRLLRRVYIVLGSVGADPDAIGRLEAQAGHLLERLGAIGLKTTRLRDRALAEAARRIGPPMGVPGA